MQCTRWCYRGLGCNLTPPPTPTPAQVRHSSYTSETLEMHCDALTPGAVVVLVDDVVATGKTLQGAIELVGEASCAAERDNSSATCTPPTPPPLGMRAGLGGGRVLECACIVEMPGLRGVDRLVAAGHSVFCLVPAGSLELPPAAAAGGSGGGSGRGGGGGSGGGDAAAT